LHRLGFAFAFASLVSCASLQPNRVPFSSKQRQSV
jgi:hypothetical protein